MKQGLPCRVPVIPGEFPGWVMEVAREAKLQGDYKGRSHDTSGFYDGGSPG